MSELIHQHLVRRLNRRVQTQREIERMNRMETKARPLIYLVMINALFVVAMTLINDHLAERDTQQARPSGGVARVVT